MRAILFTIGLVAALCAPAFGTITVVQNNNCTPTPATCSFTNAPTTGNTVLVILESGSLNTAATSVHDSNTVYLGGPIGTANNSGGANPLGYWYQVPGTPTKTYAIGAGGQPNWGMLEIGSAASGLALMASAQSYSTGGATTTNPISATVPGGALVICGGTFAGNGTSGTITTSATGAITSIVNLSAHIAASYLITTTPTSNLTCSATQNGGTVTTFAYAFIPISSGTSVCYSAQTVGAAFCPFNPTRRRSVSWRLDDMLHA